MNFGVSARLDQTELIEILIVNSSSTPNTEAGMGGRLRP
jgi:hypothetical protein